MGAPGASSPSGSAAHPTAADGTDAVELPAQPFGVIQHVGIAGCQQRAQQQGQRGGDHARSSVRLDRRDLAISCSPDHVTQPAQKEAGPAATLTGKGKRPLKPPPPC